MDKVCEKFVGITKEEIYILTAHLFEAAKLMQKIDSDISLQLLELSSATLDRINNDKFTVDDIKEIDDITKEITGE